LEVYLKEFDFRYHFQFIILTLHFQYHLEVSNLSYQAKEYFQLDKAARKVLSYQVSAQLIEEEAVNLI